MDSVQTEERQDKLFIPYAVPLLLVYLFLLIVFLMSDYRHAIVVYAFASAIA